MFKPGESAIYANMLSGETTVLRTLPDGKIETTEGIFPENDFQPGHASVLLNANPNRIELDREASRAIYLAEDRKPQASYKDVDRVQKKLEKAKLKVDLLGHWRDGKDSKYLDFGGKLRVYGISPEDLTELESALDEKRPSKVWVRVMGMYSATARCSSCASGRFREETDGQTLRLVGPPCPYPKGLGSTEWELNVPSGRIVVANDLREFFPLTYGDDHIPSSNTDMGCHITTLEHAKDGLSHAYVGNSCPGVYKVGDGSFKIGRGKAKDMVASICTTLWWYSMCDAEEFERRSLRFGGSLESASAEVIDVKPGVYRFTHFGQSEKQGRWPVYSTFTWVREADPVEDFLQKFNSVEVNANAYVQSMVSCWPSLYGAQKPDSEDEYLTWGEMSEEQKLGAWASVASRTFCNLSSGRDWHPKGFPLAKVDPSNPDVDPPSFRYCGGWYPFSENYGGLYRAENLNPSFAKLLFRLLESIISFGSFGFYSDEKDFAREAKQTRERMSLAVGLYRQRAAKYPEQADPEYVKWLSEPGRAEAWVDNFNLGI